MPRALLALALFSAAASAQGLRVGVKLAEVRSAEAQPFIAFPQREFALVRERPAECPSRELTKDARYAVVELGGKRIGLAFDAPEAALALGLLHVDAGKALVGHARPTQDGLLVDFGDATGGPVRLDVRLQYQGAELARAGLQPSRHRRGRTSLGGVQREVILVDAEGDGRYDGRNDRWIALRPERLPDAKSLRRTDMLLLGEPQVPYEADGRALMVRKVAADGSSLDLLLDAPILAQEAVLKRRLDEVRADHFEQFAKEEAAFRARNGMTAGRPRAEGAAAWSAGPLSAAKEEARRAGKPLLVFFYTESNAWSFRYDYYTLPDREVDELLRQFVLARIDAEKDPEKSWAALGATGLPCLVPLTAEGEPVSFRFRMRDDEGRVVDLDQDEKVITGWLGPAELAENLRRILRAAR